MDLEDIIIKLRDNDNVVLAKTVKILLRVINDILNGSTNKSITLKKSNKMVLENILKLNGAVDFLKFIGFIEDDESFYLQDNIQVSVVKEGKTALIELEQIVTNKYTAIGTEWSLIRKYNKHNIQPSIALPPLTLLYQNSFLNQLEHQFHRTLVYKDKSLLEKAKKLIPIKKLEGYAEERFQAFKDSIVNDEIKQPKISIQEMMLLELLQWFKDDFFTWVNQPNCVYCDGETELCNLKYFSKFFVHTKNVEHYVCKNCKKITPFPRHNNLHVLLETRSGRCGEWANTFTLFCYAMGWDSRFIMDWNDHVWVEVYSEAQQRWLHCDPCENVCDKPLLYETGWKKDITYVMAFSIDEIQDVTWRYSSKHRDVLKRRNLCSEDLLISALIKLRAERQKDYTENKRTLLQTRVLNELIELLIERRPNTNEMIGRQSGDLIWRLNRRETEITTNHLWLIDVHKLTTNIVTFKYSVARDIYEFDGNGGMSMLNKWELGTYTYINMFRKEEKDWKQVYLARKDGNNLGTIKWSFQINGLLKKLDEIEVFISYKTFENGEVKITLDDGNLTEELPKGSTLLRTSTFRRANRIVLTASLSNGIGDLSWQHAQLFRQPIGSNDFPFTVHFYFR